MGDNNDNTQRVDDIGPQRKKQKLCDDDDNDNNTNAIASSSSIFDTVCDVFYVHDLMFC